MVKRMEIKVQGHKTRGGCIREGAVGQTHGQYRIVSFDSNCNLGQPVYSVACISCGTIHSMGRGKLFGEARFPKSYCKSCKGDSK